MSSRFQRIQKRATQMMGHASRAVMGGAEDELLVLLSVLDRTRPVPAIFVDGNADPHSLLMREATFTGDIAVFGDNRRALLTGATYMGISVNGVGLNCVVQRQGVDDGPGSFSAWRSNLPSLTLLSSITALGVAASDQQNSQSANGAGSFVGPGLAPLPGAPLASGGNGVSGQGGGVFAYYDMVAGASQIRAGVSGQNKNSGTLTLAAGAYAKCVAVGKSPNFGGVEAQAAGYAISGTIGGSDGGQASVWYRLGTATTYSQRLLAGTDVDHIAFYSTGAFSGVLLLSQPDGLRAYSFADITGAWTLLWHLTEVDCFGVQILPWRKLFVGANTKALLVDPITGSVEASIPLAAGYAPAQAAFSVFSNRAFLSTISGAGQGTESKVYTLQCTPSSEVYLPYIPSLYTPLTEPTNAFHIDPGKSESLYQLPAPFTSYFDSITAAIIRQPNGKPGFRIAATNQAVIRNFASGGWNPWNNVGTTIGSFAFFFTPEGAPATNTIPNLPRVLSYSASANNIILMARGATAGDPRDCVRVFSSQNALINGEGAWAYPIVEGEHNHHTLTWSRGTTAWQTQQRFEWWVDGELFASMPSGNAPQAWAGSGPFRFGGVSAGGSALGIYHGPVVAYRRVLGPSEIRALYQYMLVESDLASP